MTVEELKTLGLEKEIHFAFSKSGGKGGQHVNKTESKVELSFNIATSNILPESARTALLKKLGNRINTDGFLVLTDETSRSQHTNRENVVKKFYALLATALKPVKKRRKTAVPRSVKEQRLKKKKRRGEIKSLRSKNF
jgi:ribosome-associated protein